MSAYDDGIDGSADPTLCIHCRELEESDPLLPMGLARAKRSDRHARTFRRLSAANQEEKP